MFLDPTDHNPNGIIEDQESLAVKGKVMRSLKSKNVFDAISKISMFLGTMITTATAGVVMGSLLHGGGMAALGAALTAPVIGALAVGVAVMAVAIATDYIGSYKGQSAGFDIQEVSAKSTARGIRTELDDLMANHDITVKTQKQKNWAAQAEAQKLAQSNEIVQRR